MVLIPVCCPHCRQGDVVKRGQTANDKQRYLCKNNECFAQTFILDYEDRGRIPDVKKQIIDMALNGIRLPTIHPSPAYTARVASKAMANALTFCRPSQIALGPG